MVYRYFYTKNKKFKNYRYFSNLKKQKTTDVIADGKGVLLNKSKMKNKKVVVGMN
jgi:hypothetical protein